MVVAQGCEFNALFVTLSIPIGYFLCITEHLFVSTGLTSESQQLHKPREAIIISELVSLLFEISSCFYHVVARAAQRGYLFTQARYNSLF